MDLKLYAFPCLIGSLIPPLARGLGPFCVLGDAVSVPSSVGLNRAVLLCFPCECR